MLNASTTSGCGEHQALNRGLTRQVPGAFGVPDPPRPRHRTVCAHYRETACVLPEREQAHDEPCLTHERDGEADRPAARQPGQPCHGEQAGSHDRGDLPGHLIMRHVTQSSCRCARPPGSRGPFVDAAAQHAYMPQQQHDSPGFHRGLDRPRPHGRRGHTSRPALARPAPERPAAKWRQQTDPAGHVMTLTIVGA